MSSKRLWPRRLTIAGLPEKTEGMPVKGENSNRFTHNLNLIHKSQNRSSSIGSSSPSNGLSPRKLLRRRHRCLIALVEKQIWSPASLIILTETRRIERFFDRTRCRIVIIVDIPFSSFRILRHTIIVPKFQATGMRYDSCQVIVKRS